MRNEDLDALDRRLTRLEAVVDRIAQRLHVPPEPMQRQSGPAAAVQPLGRFVPPARLDPTAHSDAIDAEDFLGGRVLLAVGALTLLLGISFFIKYAFDNGWIGPAGRVTIGLLAGVAFVALGQRFQKTDKTVFAGALTGLGGGILYLSLWAAGNGFHLVPLTVSFLAMALVTASLMALALRNGSQLTAVYAMLGGFITPLLNSTPVPNTLNLFVYLTLLDAALIFVPPTRGWPALAVPAFVFTQFYVLTAFMTDHSVPMGTMLTFGTLYFTLFLAQPAGKARSGAALQVHELVLTAAATGAYYMLLHAELFASHRHWLTAVVVALAALFVALAQLARSRDRAVLAAIGLALITGGVVITFSGNIVAVLWALEGALLIWAGLYRRESVVRAFGFVGLALAGLDVATYPPLMGPVFANERFVTYIAFALALFSVRASYVRFAPEALDEFERQLFTLCEPLAHASLLYAFSRELFELSHHHELSLTLFWIAYAIALFAIGLLRRASFIRWEAFTLLTIAILKAFVVDLAAVNPGVRIVSFCVLGSVMLAISYVYQRHARAAVVA